MKYGAALRSAIVTLGALTALLSAAACRSDDWNESERTTRTDGCAVVQELQRPPRRLPTRTRPADTEPDRRWRACATAAMEPSAWRRAA